VIVERTLTTTTFSYGIKSIHPSDAKLSRLALEKGLGTIVKRTQDEITAEVEIFRDTGEIPIEPYLSRDKKLCYYLYHRGVFNVISFKKDNRKDGKPSYSYSRVKSIN
jgi:hypothetical protein